MQYKPTRTKTGNEARKAILAGVNSVYEVVRETLGPDAKSILTYGTYGREPRIIDDGHHAAQVVEPQDEFLNLVARTFRESTAKTNQEGGDGTASTTVVGGSLLNALFKVASENSGAYRRSATGMNFRKVCNELLIISKKIQEKVKERSTKVESQDRLQEIATVSVGDPELGKIIAEMVWKVGVDGFVDVVEGFKSKLETEVIEGMRFPAKVPAKAFVNNQARFEMVVSDSPVLLTNYRIDTDQQLRTVLEGELREVSKLVIMAPGFSDNILANIVQTIKDTKGAVLIFPVAVPSLRTDQFEDLAIYTGAKFIDKNTGKKLENVQVTDLGFVAKLVVKDTENREDAIATGGAGTRDGKQKVANQEYAVSSPVAERIKVLKGQIEETRVEAHKKLLERRIASMASAVGVIRVGAVSRAELIPRKLKIEDAVYATKAALEEGYVKGGGLCLKEIAEEMEALPITLTESILAKSLKAPYEQIQENAGGSLEIGPEIIDPTKVVRLVVQNALSVIANLITVGAIVAEIREKSQVEGEEAIAAQLGKFVNLWGRKEGLIKENQEEVDKDMEQIYAEKSAEDTG